MFFVSMRREADVVCMRTIPTGNHRKGMQFCEAYSLFNISTVMRVMGFHNAELQMSKVLYDS